MDMGYEEVDIRTMELETLQTLMLWREKDAKSITWKRLFHAEEPATLCIGLHYNVSGTDTNNHCKGRHTDLDFW
jgi:hypothetical protein